MEKVTFLTEGQIWGDNNTTQLDVLRKYGTKSVITDFAILLGGFVSGSQFVDGDTLADRAGYYWTSSSDNDGDVRVVDNSGDKY